MTENWPRVNFRIDYWTNTQIRDDNLTPSTLTIGIKSISFFASDILLIPKIENINRSWYPKIPHPTDISTSEQEARIAMLLLEGNFVLTPCAEWKGKVEVIPYEYLKECRLEGQKIIVFFVSDSEYKEYNTEAELIKRKQINRESCLINDLKNEGFKIANFIENKIVNSPYLSDDELSNICRKRDEYGNIVLL